MDVDIGGKREQKQIIMLILYSLTHFVVDFACAFVMFRVVFYSNYFFMYVLLYNFLAFAMQMPIGAIADGVNKNVICAIVGCVLVGSAYVFSGCLPIVVLLAGIGNSMFHVGGGIDVLNEGKDKSKYLGVFVSTGAFGIYFGGILGKGDQVESFIPMMILFALAVIIGMVYYKLNGNFSSDNVPVAFRKFSFNKYIIAVICLFLVVVLRSYLGFLMSFEWKSNKVYAIICVCGVVFGKMAGGFLSDFIGEKKASIISLGLAAVLFLFSKNVVAGVLAVFLFNMTMPITLHKIAGYFKESKGFSFGLLTFALFIGFLIDYLKLYINISVNIVLMMGSLISLALLIFGISCKDNENQGLRRNI